MRTIATMAANTIMADIPRTTTGGMRHVRAPASFGSAFGIGIDLDAVFVGHRMQLVSQVFDQRDDAQK
jgi:hypothetical protein